MFDRFTAAGKKHCRSKTEASRDDKYDCKSGKNCVVSLTDLEENTTEDKTCENTCLRQSIASGEIVNANSVRNHLANPCIPCRRCSHTRSPIETRSHKKTKHGRLTTNGPVDKRNKAQGLKRGARHHPAPIRSESNDGKRRDELCNSTREQWNRGNQTCSNRTKSKREGKCRKISLSTPHHHAKCQRIERRCPKIPPNARFWNQHMDRCGDEGEGLPVVEITLAGRIARHE